MPTDDQIEALYVRFESMVLRRCRYLLDDEEEALDTMHEVFVDVIEKGDFTIHSPSGYLFVLATRKCLNKLRSKRRRPESANSELVYAIAQSSGTQGQSAARSVLEWLFGTQPESSGVIAMLYYVDGLTHAQVADEVGMSVSGVRKRLRRMRQALVAQGFEP